MAETERDYRELKQMIKGIHEELDLPRCHNCEKNMNGVCHQYRAEIPKDHEYKYTKCEHWKQGVPF